MATAAAILTTKEASDLALHEKTIRQGLSTFYEVGSALLAIRDGRLYRASHKRFEDYCQEQWNMTRMRAAQLIEAAEAAADVKHVLQKPENSRQASALAKAPKEKRADVWEKVVGSAPLDNGKPKITAKHVEKVVAEELAYEPEEERPCHDYLDQPIPKNAQEAFRSETLFDDAIGRARALANAIKDITQSPAGGFMNSTQANRLIRDIRSLIDEARPYALCPYCKGRKCSACAQSGIVPKKVLEAAQ